jgi:hypothetical protein
MPTTRRLVILAKDVQQVRCKAGFIFIGDMVHSLIRGLDGEVPRYLAIPKMTFERRACSSDLCGLAIGGSMGAMVVFLVTTSRK